MRSKSVFRPQANMPTLLSRQRGLTLIEVMVALLIFGLTGVAMLKAASDNLNGVQQLKSITFANYVANNRLQQLHILNTWPINNNQKGTVEMVDQTWYWRQEVSKTGIDDLVQVRVVVSLDEAFNETITDVIGLYSKPNAGL